MGSLLTCLKTIIVEIRNNLDGIEGVGLEGTYKERINDTYLSLHPWGSFNQHLIVGLIE